MQLPMNFPLHVQDRSLLAYATYRERSSSLSSSESQLWPSLSESTQSEKEAKQLSATPSMSSTSNDEDSDDERGQHNSKYEVEIIGKIRHDLFKYIYFFIWIMPLACDHLHMIFVRLISCRCLWKHKKEAKYEYCRCDENAWRLEDQGGNPWTWTTT